jgi:hypothetical protein
MFAWNLCRAAACRGFSHGKPAASRGAKWALAAIVSTTVIAFAIPTRADPQPTIDELLNLKPPATQPASRDAPPAEKGVPIDPAGARRLSAGEAADLFHEALGQMAEASERLGRTDAGLDTQRLQLAVLSKLDQVIAAAEQNSGQPPPSKSSPKPPDSGSEKNAQAQPGKATPRPSPASTGGNAPLVKGEKGTDKPIESNRSEWGNLPPRLREELQQGLNERFSPVYRELTERYYKRLAEEGR